MLMTLLYYNVFRHNKRSKYLQRMHQCFAWFLGENDLRIPLYEHETYGCCDGLESYGVNRNQGAESTLAYLFARMCILDSQDSELQLAEKKKTAIGNSSKTRSRNYRGPAFGKIEKIQN